MAYRDVELVKECLKDSVDIIQQLRPIINCKGWYRMVKDGMVKDGNG